MLIQHEYKNGMLFARGSTRSREWVVLVFVNVKLLTLRSFKQDNPHLSYWSAFCPLHNKAKGLGVQLFGLTQNLIIKELYTYKFYNLMPHIVEWAHCYPCRALGDNIYIN